MATISVSFDGTRLNSSDSNTGWGNYNTGGGAPASEAANAYQQDTPGSAVGAVGKKVNSTTTRIGVDYLGTSVNYGGNDYLWYCKVYVSDSFDLNTTYGVEVAIGSGNGSNYNEYNIAGSGANNDAFLTYPPQGGYILAAIDPAVAQWREAQSGTFNSTAVIWYAVGAAFIGGFAKSENVAMDAIDYGKGLILIGGGSPDPVATFLDYRAWDQDIKSNRYGVVSGQAATMQARGKLVIGDSTGTNPTEFADSTTILTFNDGYVNNNSQGIIVNIRNASDDISINNTIIGAGKLYGLFDTRPNFEVLGSTGVFRSSANLRNHNKIAYTNACIIDGADIECRELSNAGEIKNSIIRTDALSPIPALNNAVPANFGTTSGIHDTEFIQTGSFHAIRMSAGNTYTLTNVMFTGYGANGTSTSAIQILSTTGTVTININGGDTPTYTSSGAAVVINNTKLVKVTVLDADTLSPIQNARVLLEAGSGGPLSAGTDILSGLTDVNGVIEDAAFSYTGNQPVTGRVRKSTSPDPLYQQGNITGTITVNGFDTTILLISDE